MGHGIVYGSYNPLSFLMRTWADSRDALLDSLPIDFIQWPPKETPDDDILMGMANFIHEYTHYLQTTSRAHNISLLEELPQTM